MIRIWIFCGAVLLAACGGPALLVSTLDRGSGSQPPASYVGVQVPALAPERVDAYLREAEKTLARQLKQEAHGLDGVIHRDALNGLRLELSAERSFDAGSAQLDAAALAGYAALADSFAGLHSLVVHVVVHGPGIAGEDSRTGVTARRSATLYEYFVRRGLTENRLRAESRQAVVPVVELVLMPVIRGREAQAWMPPPG